MLWKARKLFSIFMKIVLEAYGRKLSNKVDGIKITICIGIVVTVYCKEDGWRQEKARRVSIYVSPSKARPGDTPLRRVKKQNLAPKSHICFNLWTVQTPNLSQTLCKIGCKSGLTTPGQGSCQLFSRHNGELVVHSKALCGSGPGYCKAILLW